VGYRSKKNFYQQFRKHYGTTPVLYRSDPTVAGGSEHECAAVSVRDATALPSAASSPAASSPATPSPTASRSSEPRPAEGEPSATLSGVAPIIRASNRAWRLAIRAQQVMVEHFHRFRIAMLITDLDGHYVGANRAALAMTGYSALELRALSPSALFVEPLDTDVRCVWQLLLVRDGRSDQPSSATVRTKTGTAVCVHLITLRNFLWGRRELSPILEGVAVTG
jgi:PAS domain S-box-containing protein